MSKHVAVIIGAGGMGLAVARRIGSGRQLLLADFDTAQLDRAAVTLRQEGFDVTTSQVDVGSAASVDALAQAAAAAGPVLQVVHTAGVSPTQAPVEVVLRVDLLGTAHVLASFERVITAGGAAVVVASAAGHRGAELDAELKRTLAEADPADLLSLPHLATIDTPTAAYRFAKRANIVQVQAAAPAWGRRGARVNSLSPGHISTPMGQQELAGPEGERLWAAIAASPAARLGTAEDIADGVAFLLGPSASFVTGTDLLVDGGSTAARKSVDWTS